MTTKTDSITAANREELLNDMWLSVPSAVSYFAHLQDSGQDDVVKWVTWETGEVETLTKAQFRSGLNKLSKEFMADKEVDGYLRRFAKDWAFNVDMADWDVTVVDIAAQYGLYGELRWS